MMAKGAKPSGDGLDILGEQLTLDPKALQLLKENGSITEGEFQALLEATQGEGETLMNMMGGDEAKAEKLIQNSEKIPEAQGLQGQPENPELAKLLQMGQPTQQSNTAAVSQGQPVVMNEAGIAKQVEGANVPTQANQKTIEALNNMAKTAPTKAPQMNAVSAQAKVQETIQSDTGAKLYNLNDFMGRQSSSAKQRAISSNAYQPEQSIFSKNTEMPVGDTVTKNAVKQTTSLQDLMFGESSDQLANEAGPEVVKQVTSQIAKTQMNPASTQAKVFDIGSMNENMTTDQVISKIQDYIIQTKVGNEKQLDFSFHHKDLGKVDLLVQKGQQNSMNIVIGTNTAEGAQFFSQNRGELLQSLSQAGVQVNDLKLDAGSKSSNQEFAGDSRGSNHGSRGHGSQSGERQQEQQKRESLWQQFYKDKEVA